jgi:hypothetical protein
MVEPQLLTRGKLEGQSVNPSNTVYLQGPSGVNMIHCEGEDELTIEVDMTGAVAGDVILTVEPYSADGTTVLPMSLPAVNAPAAVFATGHVYAVASYDVSGQDIVRVGIKNNNASTQTITRASWRLS